MDKVLNFIHNLNIDKNNFVIVACSGGPDSIFLLQLLNKLGYKCVCAHVNHNVREASKDEFTYIEKFCKNNNIVFEGIVINEYDEKKNFHEFAREFRYNFFKQLIDKYNSKYLFTAHHGDDLMETILMRLVRGSSLTGYAGFRSLVVKDDYYIVRPLIFLTKDEIENYNRIENIEYVVDESNLTDHYTRNRFRHHVLPFIKNENSNAHIRFLNYSNIMYECIDYVDKIVDSKLQSCYKNNVLEIDLFNENELFIKKNILDKILRKWYLDNLYLVDENTIIDIMNIIDNSKPNIKYNLPDGLFLIKEYNRLCFTKEDKVSQEFNIIFEEKLNIDKYCFEKVDNIDDESNNVIRLNSKDIKLPLYFRSKKEGDVIHVKNMNGKTKIKKIFIDSKIPLSKRDTYPLLVDSNDDILWIPGLKKSKKDVLKNGEYDLMIKYEKRRDFNEK